MAGGEPIELPGIELEPAHIHQAVTATLHTILFCRLLGATRPVDAVADQFGLTYATVGDPAVSSAVASKAASVAAWADRHRGRRAAVRLCLFEGGGGGGGGSDKAKAAAPSPWETWVLPLAVCGEDAGGGGPAAPSPSSQLASPSSSASAAAAEPPLPGRGRPGLEAVLLAAAASAADRREGVPPVLTPAVATFPFAIDLLPVPAVPGCNGRSGGTGFGLGAVKRLLLQASPPSVLS